MSGPGSVAELQTPALIVDRDAVEHNLATMAAALPGLRMRPHVKAHKSTAIALRQHAAGHRGFTCATIREVEVLAAVGDAGQDRHHEDAGVNPRVRQGA